MRIDELLENNDQELADWQATRSLCKSSKPDSALGSSALSSCKSQGYRRREGKKSHKIGQKRVTMGGKKLIGKKYGGDIPDYGSGS